MKATIEVANRVQANRLRAGLKHRIVWVTVQAVGALSLRSRRLTAALKRVTKAA